MINRVHRTTKDTTGISTTKYNLHLTPEHRRVVLVC